MHYTQGLKEREAKEDEACHELIVDNINEAVTRLGLTLGGTLGLTNDRVRWTCYNYRTHRHQMTDDDDDDDDHNDVLLLLLLITMMLLLTKTTTFMMNNGLVSN